MSKFLQVRAPFHPQRMRQYGCRNDGGPTGCVNTLPDLDQHHLLRRKCRP